MQNFITGFLDETSPQLDRKHSEVVVIQQTSCEEEDHKDESQYLRLLMR
ncbi:hypothetical protein FHEFKHOI_00872 [Candidatus Methanoperedenaceae archaeon GB50]|nr:hypothetical protein FHEFKHOI_00872 [Candidatus Methanoperedenaceae archaeon GB50]CAD7780407.1 MAG: hypothetical protein KBONHNOK_01469 [Candidatus Methanoperedenaceae archaeon GB50]